MPINSCRKGKVAEREVAAICREYGLSDCKRGQQHKGGVDSPDIANFLPGFHVEIKRDQRAKIGTEFLARAMAQSMREAGPGETPLVVFRRNGEPWKVLWIADKQYQQFMLFTEWLEMRGCRK